MKFIVIEIILFIVILIFLALMLLYTYKAYVYKSKCTSTTRAIIKKYDKFNDSNLHNAYVTPIFTYMINGKEYTKKNDVYAEQMIKKETTIRYWEKKPQYAYIESLGCPNMQNAVKLFGILEILTIVLEISICIIGS